MTVQELINRLQKCKPTDTVFFHCDDEVIVEVSRVDDIVVNEDTSEHYYTRGINELEDVEVGTSIVLVI